MDYVVFGLGFGATLMLLGWALRTFGPGMRYAFDDDDATDEQYETKHRWVQFATGLGAVFAVTGLVMVLVTVIMQLVNVENRVGDWINLTLAVLSAIVALGWAWVFNQNFGLDGIAVHRSDLEDVPSSAPLYDDDYRPAAGSHDEDEDEEHADEIDDEFDFGPIPDDSVDERLARRATRQTDGDDVEEADVATEADETTGESASTDVASETGEPATTSADDPVVVEDTSTTVVERDQTVRDTASEETVTISVVDAAKESDRADSIGEITPPEGDESAGTASEADGDEHTAAYRALTERWASSEQETERTPDEVAATAPDRADDSVENGAPGVDLSEGIFAEDITRDSEAPVEAEQSPQESENLPNDAMSRSDRERRPSDQSLDE